VDRPGDLFVDYYELMQISHNAEMETIQRVYRMLAGRYHPDNANTGDMERFLRLNEAYRVLSDPQERAEYDADYRAQHLEPIELFNLRDFAVGIDGESNRRMGVLCLLYNRRRVNGEDPGLSLLEFEKLMTCPREHLVFTIWYLRDKGYLRQTEDSSYAITSSGVDYVEAGLPKNRILYKLIKEAEDGAVRSATSRTPASTEEARA
jgi:curved DNA-binding protein CbpA